MTSGECSVDQTFMKEKPVLPLVLKMALQRKAGIAACFEDGPADGHINARQFAV